MIPVRHILQQGPVIKGIGATVASSVMQRFRPKSSEPPATPGIEIHDTIPPRPADLIEDYVRHVGGNPDSYRDSIPAHMFPQWMFPYSGRTLASLPYPLMAVVNAGCRIEMNALLPQGQPLNVSARLESLKVDDRRVLLSQRLITGTDHDPEALVAHLYAYIPRKSAGGGKAGGGKALVPDGARELERWHIPAKAGLEFAILTGDVNPLHWIRPYARMLGFKERILHGFSTMARTIECLYRRLYDGKTWSLATVDVKFTRPLVLPASVGVYVLNHRVFVGDSVGGAAYLEGSFAPRE